MPADVFPARRRHRPARRAALARSRRAGPARGQGTHAARASLVPERSRRRAEAGRDLARDRAGLPASALDASTRHAAAYPEPAAHTPRPHPLQPLRPLPVPALFERANELTEREKEVLQWIAEGRTSREVGLILSIAERTVKFHLRNIYAKLNVLNRTQAVSIANRMNLG
ncbi:helix-turn-helix transcriptional regulator [Lysobacter enzymogenes]|nr:helix-turn-helix transcriptional regulator [Lysobacter enzymogenes]